MRCTAARCWSTMSTVNHLHMTTDLRVMNKGFTWQLSHNQNYVSGCGWCLPGYLKVCMLDPALKFPVLMAWAVIQIFQVDGKFSYWGLSDSLCRTRRTNSALSSITSIWCVKVTKLSSKLTIYQYSWCDFHPRMPQEHIGRWPRQHSPW